MEVTAPCITLVVNMLLLFTARAQSRKCVFAGGAYPHIDPNRQQFFEYEPISFSCAGFHGLAGWRVVTRAASGSAQWDTSTGSLDIKPAFVSHSGEYWCENGDGVRSSSLNITITAGDVILESPALPVMEGDAISLRCRKQGLPSNFPADFYKDGRLIKTGYEGEMIIHDVSKSDEGLYKCSISGSQGDSPESWLVVSGVIPGLQNTTCHEVQESSTPSLHTGSVQPSILVAVAFTILCVVVLLLVVGLLQCRKRRVTCFSSETPTPEPDPVYEDVHPANTEMSAYASVNKSKKKRRCQEKNVADPNNVTYTTVTMKERVFRAANIPDPNRTTYAAVTLRKERGH